MNALRWATALVLSLLAMASACAQNSAPSDPSEQSSAAISHTDAEPDIYEAVFRYQFDHNASAIQGRAAKYCLSLPEEKMPSATFLQRFAGNHPPVAAADQCERKSAQDLFFRIQHLDWRKDHEVWVRGGYWEGNLSASTELYRVLNENGKWVVTGARMEAIS
jgi:hypothetical protein